MGGEDQTLKMKAPYRSCIWNIGEDGCAACSVRFVCCKCHVCMTLSENLMLRIQKMNSARCCEQWGVWHKLETYLDSLLTNWVCCWEKQAMKRPNKYLLQSICFLPQRVFSHVSWVLCWVPKGTTHVRSFTKKLFSPNFMIHFILCNCCTLFELRIVPDLVTWWFSSWFTLHKETQATEVKTKFDPGLNVTS